MADELWAVTIVSSYCPLETQLRLYRELESAFDFVEKEVFPEKFPNDGPELQEKTKKILRTQRDDGTYYVGNVLIAKVQVYD